MVPRRRHRLRRRGYRRRRRPVHPALLQQKSPVTTSPTTSFRSVSRVNLLAACSLPSPDISGVSFCARRSCPGRRWRALGSRRRGAPRCGRSRPRNGHNLPITGWHVRVLTPGVVRVGGEKDVYLEDRLRRRVSGGRFVPGYEGVGHVHCHLPVGSVVARQHHHHVVVQGVVQVVRRLLHRVQVAVQHHDARTGASPWPTKLTQLYQFKYSSYLSQKIHFFW
jgi:hypothetical protein